MAAARAPDPRRELVAYAQRMASDGLAVGTSGNLSVRAGDDLLVTPGGVAYEAMGPDDIVRVRPDGEVLAGDGHGPAPHRATSELAMHRLAYEVSRAGAVVHTHSPYATAIACVLDELPPVHYVLAGLGGRVPVVAYATFGSDELADGVARGLAGRAGVLLGNHGTLTVGADLAEAYGHAQTLEWCAALYLRARQLGEPRVLDDGEIARVAEKMRALGYLADRGEA